LRLAFGPGKGENAFYFMALDDAAIRRSGIAI
jgi:hypothetical protein